MKIKGVSTFEQHVEKIVLVAVSGVFLLVIALQLLVQPNTVTVGKESKPPGRAYDGVQAQALTVQGKMMATDVETPEIPASDLVGDFKKRLSAPVAPAGAKIAFGEPTRIEGASPEFIPSRGLSPIAAIAIPAPTRPVVNSFWSTIDPGLRASNAEVAKLLPPAQPFDKVAVSCEMRFDGAALHKRLQADPDGDGGPARALPMTWYRDATEILAVRLEREELTPTGEWTGLTEVPMPPGLENLQAEVEKDVRTQGDLTMIVSQARSLAEDVRRPEFWRMIAGEPWVPPSEASRVAAGAEVPQAVQTEFRRLDQKTIEHKRAQGDLDRAKEGPRRPAAGQPQGEMTTPRGGGRQPDRDTGDRENEARNKKIAAAETRLKKAAEDIAAIQNTIRGLGYDSDTREAVVVAAGKDGSEGRSLLDSPSVRLWAHDVTAQPGKTYRYRGRVAVNNPVYGRAASLVAEQQDLAKHAVILGEASEWSDPVEVLSDQYFFVTSASESDDLAGMQRASTELYRVFYGFYRKGNASLEPGDAAAAQVALPDAAKLPIWDMAKLKQPTTPDRSLPPTTNPRFETPGKGGGGEETILLPDTRQAPERQPDRAADVPATLPEGAKGWEEPVRVAMDVVLLDVALAPTASEAAISGQQARARPQAYLRDGMGRIIIRVPDADRTGDLYRRVSESAKKGENQGEPPKPKIDEADPGTPRRPKPKPEDSGGGGGKGGGGGGG